MEDFKWFIGCLIHLDMITWAWKSLLDVLSPLCLRKFELGIQLGIQLGILVGLELGFGLGLGHHRL